MLVSWPQDDCHPPAILFAFLAGRRQWEGVEGTCQLVELSFNGAFPDCSPMNLLFLLIGQLCVSYALLNAKVAEKISYVFERDI